LIDERIYIMPSTHTPTPGPLDILFLVNFSDYCFRSVPAVAEMAGTVKVRLTLMHVYDGKRTDQKTAQARLQSFFPEADRYAACQRIAVEGSVFDAVRRHRQVWPASLIMAPASDDIGIPRLGSRSKRGRLIRESGVPVWTIGRHVQLANLNRPVRNIACWIDFDRFQTGHLAYAVEYAAKCNAKLHLLHALPSIDEGMLSVAARRTVPPMHPTLAREEILQLCDHLPVRPEVHIGTGEGSSTVAKMLRACDADVVFLADEPPSLTEWLGGGLSLGDRLPCPAIYVGSASKVPVWNLEPVRTQRTRVALHAMNASASWAKIPA
jgi:hypothetical protein